MNKRLTIKPVFMAFNCELIIDLRLCVQVDNYQ